MTDDICRWCGEPLDGANWCDGCEQPNGQWLCFNPHVMPNDAEDWPVCPRCNLDNQAAMERGLEEDDDILPDPPELYEQP
jgi:hypothetical protein